MDLQNPDDRVAFEIVAKYIIIIFGGIWTFIVGTDYLQKQKTTLDLSNAVLSIESVPTADTSIEMVQPVGVSSKDALCYPKGKYLIKNTGTLPIVIENATVTIFELPTAYLDDADDAASFSPDTLLEGREPMKSWNLGPSETIGVGNTFERVFGLTIRKKPDHNYIIVTNAKGRLPATKSNSDDPRVMQDFRRDDLRHLVQLGGIC